MRTLQKLLAPIRRRIALLVSRAVVNLVDDSLKLQGLQVTLLADETMDGVERFQQYGFTAHPHSGAEAIALSVGGHRSHTVVIAVDDRRYRVKSLEAGEVAIYTDEGDRIHLRRGNLIEVETSTLRVNAATKVELNTPLVTTTGEIRADDDITDRVPTNAHSMSDMRSTYNTHTHPGDSGGSTGQPNQSM